LPDETCATREFGQADGSAAIVRHAWSTAIMIVGIDEVNLIRKAFHVEWNYTIAPRRRRES